ncbi:hypothetical protein ES703_79385 [subsurface metagenome]
MAAGSLNQLVLTTSTSASFSRSRAATSSGVVQSPTSTATSSTGLPNSPPALLISFLAISSALIWCRPSSASRPVIAVPIPTLIGSTGASAAGLPGRQPLIMGMAIAKTTTTVIGIISFGIPFLFNFITTSSKVSVSITSLNYCSLHTASPLSLQALFIPAKSGIHYFAFPVTSIKLVRPHLLAKDKFPLLPLEGSSAPQRLFQEGGG